IVLGPGDFASALIENCFAGAFPLALFVKLYSLENAKRIGIDCRFDMLVKIDIEKSDKKTVTGYIADEPQRHFGIGVGPASSTLFHLCGHKTKGGNINLAKYRSRYLGFVNQFLTRFEWPDWTLADCEFLSRCAVVYKPCRQEQKREN